MEAPAWMLPGRDHSGSRSPRRQAKLREGILGPLRGDDRADQLVKLLTVLTKLCLSNANLLRDLIGAVYYTFLIDATNPISQALVACGRSYAKRVEEEGKDRHTQGPPFLHMWIALLLQLGKSSLEPVNEGPIEKYWADRVIKVAKEELVSEIRHCRIKECYHDKKKQGPKLMKLTFAFAPAMAEHMDLEHAVVRSIAALGGTRKVGPPPRSALEREAQSLLDQLAD